jgi:phospholipid/cholesterol/gamma-HCH transport system substrate-binding protein
MPRTRSLAWTELKIGLVALFAIVMAGLLVFMLSSTGGFFWQRYTLRTVVIDGAGLSEGSPVRLAGVDVGSVAVVAFAGDRVEVVMEVNSEMQPRITSESMASLGSVSLLGEAAIDITAASGGTPIPEGGYVPSGVARGSIASVATEATESLQTVTDLLAAARRGEGTVGRLLTDDSLYEELNGFVAAAEAVTLRMGEGDGTLARLINDPTAAEALEGSLENLEAMMTRIRNGEGSLGRFLTDDALGEAVTATTTNLWEITGRLNRGEGTAGRLLTDDALYERLNSMAARLDAVTASLAEGEGTAGRLLSDQALYENMNGAVSEVRSLVQDIRADPRRYLNVRVSLF